MNTISEYGFIRTAAAVPEVRLGCCSENASEIVRLAKEAEANGAAAIVFPELSVTGYTCADLFLHDRLLDSAEKAVEEIAAATSELEITVIIGVPVRFRERLYNCAAVISDGHIAGIVPKTYIPNYGEFYEARWFESGVGISGEITFASQQHIPFGSHIIFVTGGVRFGIEICEDLWTPLPPSTILSAAGAELIFNLSASNELAGKHDYRTGLISQQSGRCICGYIYASAGYGESTTDLVYAGEAVIAENGKILKTNERFLLSSSVIYADIDTRMLASMRRKMNTFAIKEESLARAAENMVTVTLPDPKSPETLIRDIDSHPFIPKGKDSDRKIEEIINIQMTGLITRIDRIKSKSAVIGISGGLDSTLALLITVLAYDRLGWPRDQIIGVTMPGFGTTGRTKSNAVMLMERLGISTREISIVPAINRHFEDIGIESGDKSVAYENSQARERTQIIMDLANLTGGIVVGTGDLSESALGWCTFNGDHMSMYNVNGSIPKTLVIHLVKWIADNRASVLDTDGTGNETRKILYDIIDTPISPELLPADSKGNISQKTEDIIGPYELHDFFIYHFVRLSESPDKILYLAEKAFCGKYDRDCIMKWLDTFIRRFFTQQFKRSSMPDSPKVGTVSLSPRGDWRMPSDSSYKDWRNI